MKDHYLYPAVFHYASDGISVEFPDLPGCLTCGPTTEDALYMASIAVKGKQQNKARYSKLKEWLLKAK